MNIKIKKLTFLSTDIDHYTGTIDGIHCDCDRYKWYNNKSDVRLSISHPGTDVVKNTGFLVYFQQLLKIKNYHCFLIFNRNSSRSKYVYFFKNKKFRDKS